jgi:hypothetical protein
MVIGQMTTSYHIGQMVIGQLTLHRKFMNENLKFTGAGQSPSWQHCLHILRNGTPQQ